MRDPRAMAVTAQDEASTPHRSSSPGAAIRSSHLSSSSSSPYRSVVSATGNGALLLVDAERVVAFQEARRKFAMYGKQNAHVSHLSLDRKTAAARSTAAGDGDSNDTNMKSVRKRATMLATTAECEDDNTTVLKNTLLLQENGELALHLDNLNYRLDGVFANCGLDDDTTTSTAEQLYIGAQNVVELARLLQSEQVQLVLKLASPSQNLYARIRKVMGLLLLPVSSDDDKAHEDSLRLAVAVMSLILTQSADSDEFFTSDTLDLIVQCLEKSSSNGRAFAERDEMRQVTEPIAAAVTLKTDQPMPLKKTCLKRKAGPLKRARSSSVSSGDDAGEQQLSDAASDGCADQLFAKIKGMLESQELFCVGDQVLQNVSTADVLVVVLHNLLQMDKPQDQQHFQAGNNCYHRGQRDLAVVTFSTVLARKRQLIGNRGLDAITMRLVKRFQHLKASLSSANEVPSSMTPSASQCACSLWRVQAVLRVLDQASFLATEVQQYLSSKAVLFEILLESIDELSEICWGSRQANSIWTSSSASTSLHHLVAVVFLVSMRVLINLTHHNEDATRQIHSHHGMRVLFRAFCKLWGFAEASKRSSSNKGTRTTVVFDEKLLFDALLMCLSALTNCVEFNEENQKFLSNLAAPSDGISGLQAFKTTGVCELLTHFFLSKVQSYLRLIEMSESQSESSQVASVEREESQQWVPEDVVLGGCTSLLLGCLMKGSASASSAVLSILPDGSPHLLLRALSAFVAVHSQIGALTPEVGDSVLQVEQTLKAFLSEQEVGYSVTSTAPSTPLQTVKITINVKSIDGSRDEQQLSSQDQARQPLIEDNVVPRTEEKEVTTPPAAAFKLQRWKKVCASVDSDSESGDGEAARMRKEVSVLSARPPNARSPKKPKIQSPAVRSPSVKRLKKEKASRKSPSTRSPAAALLASSATRPARRDDANQGQASPQRLKRTRELMSELAVKLSQVRDDAPSITKFSAVVTSTASSSKDQQHNDDDGWHLDFSKDNQPLVKKKAERAAPPIKILSRDSSPMTPGARKRARTGKLPSRSPNRPKLAVPLTTTSLSQQTTLEEASRKPEPASSKTEVSVASEASLEIALKRKRKAAKPPPSTSTTEAAAVFDFFETPFPIPWWKENKADEGQYAHDQQYGHMQQFFYCGTQAHGSRLHGCQLDGGKASTRARRSVAPSISPTSDSSRHSSQFSSRNNSSMRSMQWHAEWPSADDRPELQTLKAKIFRRSILGSLYFVWVCGVTGSAAMAAYSLYATTRSALSFNAIPVPRSVVYFVTFIVLYETYHWLTPGLHRWDAARRFMHHMFAKYPYFRRTVCVFEVEEEEREAKALKTERLKSDDDDAEGVNRGDHIGDGDHIPVKPEDKALFAFHPHGILSCGFGMNGVHNPTFTTARTRWLVAGNLFWFPIMRDLLHWMDSSSVKKETFVELMKKEQNIGFLPGGFEDATLYRRGKHRVFIKNRFGFIKLALQFGYKVYPVYTFGEELTFDALPYFLHFRLKLNAFKVPAALFVGSPWCFFMPRSNVDLVTIVGKPLELPTIRHPTKQEVKKHHARYVNALQALFEKHKAKYCVDPDATLELY